jgi:hypothetical protein
MRVGLILIASLLAAIPAGAQNFRRMSRVEAEGLIRRDAATYNGPRTQLSMWIWSDKYTYTAGENLTLKWTVKTNGDLYPYTVFVYRQNNQTGKKTYFPGASAEPTDINGNTAAQGFQPLQMTDTTKGVLIGSGGKFAAVNIPNELGMHTFVVELRDYTGTKPLKTSYMKIGVVQGSSDISGDITSDMTLTNDTLWNLKGGVFVKDGATLTIEPGTFLMGSSGSPPSILLITQTGKIMAKGTRSRPIIMTSPLPFGQRNRGDWAGLVLLGKAPINVGANSGGNTNAAGTFYIEGLNTTPDGLYGGDDPTHNCGTLEYVRVEYAGFILSPNNEINSFTFGGCGTDTVADHLEANYGLDDTFEWFGGTMNAKYLLGMNGRDDYLDFQLGFVGKVQNLIGLQSPGFPGNRGIEGDNSEYDAAATPFSAPTVFNATFIGPGTPGFDESDAPGIFLRRGVRGSYNNILAMNFNSACMEIADPNTQAQADAGNLTMNGILCYNDNLGSSAPNTIEGQIDQEYSQAYAKGQKGNGAGKNFLAANPILTKPMEYNDPDFSSLFGSPVFRAGWVQPPDDGFFDQSAQYIGAMGSVDWTQEWSSYLVDSDIAP